MQILKWGFHLAGNGLEKGFMINFFFFFFRKKIFFILFFILSCKPKTSPTYNNWVIREFINVELISKESGRIKMELKAPIIQEHCLSGKKIYTLFPKGLEVFFYKENEVNKTSLKANWAKFSENTKLYEAKGEIVLKSAKGDQLETSHIFWDQKGKKIYNQVASQIKKANGTILNAKNGLEGSDDLKKIFLKNTDGSIFLKEDVL